MSGGTTTESKTELPQWYVDYAQPALGLATDVSQIGYVPQVGPEFAAMTQPQVSALQSANDWSAAFNTPGQVAPDVQSQLMQPNSSINGMPAYSSYPQYQASMDLYKQMFPAQYKDIASFSNNPVTGGAAPAYGAFPGGSTAPMTPYTPEPVFMTDEERKRQADIQGRGNER